MAVLTRAERGQFLSNPATGFELGLRRALGDRHHRSTIESLYFKMFVGIHHPATGVEAAQPCARDSQGDQSQPHTSPYIISTLEEVHMYEAISGLAGWRVLTLTIRGLSFSIPATGIELRLRGAKVDAFTAQPLSHSIKMVVGFHHPSTAVEAVPTVRSRIAGRPIPASYEPVQHIHA